MRTQVPGPASFESLMSYPGERLGFKHGIALKDRMLLVLSHPSESVSSEAFLLARDELLALLRKELQSPSHAPVFKSVHTFGHTPFSDDIYISSDKKHLLFVGVTVAPISDTAVELRNAPAAFTKYRKEHPEFQLRYLSQGTSDNEMFELIHNDLDKSLFITIPLTFFILWKVFGTLAAAFIPLLVALVSLGASLGFGAMLSHVVGPVNATASQLVVLLVLAIGVDYSLFIITRVREEVAKGQTFEFALQTARTKTCRAVFWSAITVALSLLGLFFMNDTILSSMAIISIAAVLLTALGSLKVVPAILELAPGIIKKTERTRESHPWFSKLVRASVRHPYLVLISVGGPLLVLSSFVYEIKLGSTIEPDILPKSMETHAAFQELKKQFPDVIGVDFSLVVKGQVESERFENAIQALQDAIGSNYPDVRGPLAVDKSADGALARYQFVVERNPNEPEAQAVIRGLRAREIPELLASEGIEAYVSGRLAYIVDESARYRERTIFVFTAVLFMSAILLLIAFRSVAISVKAILLNCLSAASAFGAMVVIFQGSESFPWHYSVIEAFVPALLFSILFGLSMDYHVLLLSRIREEWSTGKSLDEALIVAIESTAGAINNAALIMISVFAVVITLELPVMKELGVGLAIAVAIDATLVRTFLLPACMKLLGKWNWYFPNWLKWLPEFSE